MYSIISETEYYGPETVTRLTEDNEGRTMWFRTQREANAAMEVLLGQYGIYLSHNQAAGSQYRIARARPNAEGRWRGHYVPEAGR